MNTQELKMWENIENGHLENSYNGGSSNPLTLEELSLKLQKLGLSGIEVKLYLTLLTYGTMTAVQAADRSAVSRSRAYDALASLERKGLLASPPVKPTRYGVSPPGESLRELVNRVSDEYSKQISELSKIADELVGNLQPIFKKKPSGPIDVAWMINGVRNIQSELRAMLSNAEKQVFISYDPKFDSLHNLRNFGARIRKLQNQGIELRFLFDLSSSAIQHAENFGKTFGADVRFGHRPFGPAGVYTIGEKQTLIAYPGTAVSHTYDMAFNLIGSPLAGMLLDTFAKSWEEGVPLEKARKMKRT